MSQSFSPSFSTAFKLFQALKLREDLLQSSSREAMRVLAQPDFWTSAQRGVFRQAFEGVLFESLDHLALARFTLPAEYVAAMIVAFVHPVNHLAACKWSEHHGVDADSMAISVNETAEYEPFTARQMFAIVCNIVSILAYIADYYPVDQFPEFCSSVPRETLLPSDVVPDVDVQEVKAPPRSKRGGVKK